MSEALSEGMAITIKDKQGNYLSECTASRGSAAGVGRIWGDRSSAMTFATRALADATLEREFADYERDLMGVYVDDSIESIAESAKTRWQLPQTPYEWSTTGAIGGVMLGDGTFAAIGAIVFEDQAFTGYGRHVRIVSATTTADGRATWVVVQPLDYRTMRPQGESRVLYSPDHLWRSMDLATEASKQRAQGNHRIGVFA